MAEARPTVLVLGASGFIGRNLIKHLVDESLVSFVRAVDKSLPAVSYHARPFKVAFDNKDLVEFKQADISKPQHLDRAFSGRTFDIVINLAGETRFALGQEEYRVKCVETAKQASARAAADGIARWIEVSTAQVYQANSKQKAAYDESAPIEPWTTIARFRSEAEEAVRAHGESGGPMQVVTLRPAVVYGPGDLTGLMPRACCAAVYKETAEKMKFLYGAKVKMNTVHVRDVARAIWLAATADGASVAGKVYNLADSGDTDQGKVNDVLAELFEIKTGFTNAVINAGAKKFPGVAADRANEKHVGPFHSICTKNEIMNTPVSAYIDAEVLTDKHTWIDGTQISKDLSFVYQVPELTVETLREQVQLAIDQKIFPPVI